MLGGTCWTLVIQFPGLPALFYASLGYLVRGGPSLSEYQLSAWLALRSPSLVHPELGSFCIRKIACIDPNALIAKALWMISIGFVLRFFCDRLARTACCAVNPG